MPMSGLVGLNNVDPDVGRSPDPLASGLVPISGCAGATSVSASLLDVPDELYSKLPRVE